MNYGYQPFPLLNYQPPMITPPPMNYQPPQHSMESSIISKPSMPFQPPKGSGMIIIVVIIIIVLLLLIGGGVGLYFYLRPPVAVQGDFCPENSFEYNLDQCCENKPTKYDKEKKMYTECDKVKDMPKYYRRENIAYIGDNSLGLAAVKVNDERDCKKTCNNTTNCRGFEFDTTTKDCLMFRGSDRSAGVDKSVIAYVYDRNKNEYYQNDVVGRSIAKNDYGAVINIASAADCAKECNKIDGKGAGQADATKPGSEKGCTHFDYVSETKYCWPKYSTPNTNKVVNYRLV